MNSRIQKLNTLFNDYIGKNWEIIIEELGPPDVFSEDDIWTYSCRKYLFFREETIFFMKNQRVVDIAITEFFLHKVVRIIFCHRGIQPEFKDLRLFRLV